MIDLLIHIIMRTLPTFTMALVLTLSFADCAPEHPAGRRCIQALHDKRQFIRSGPPNVSTVSIAWVNMTEPEQDFLSYDSAIALRARLPSLLSVRASFRGSAFKLTIVFQYRRRARDDEHLVFPQERRDSVSNSRTVNSTALGRCHRPALDLPHTVKGSPSTLYHFSSSNWCVSCIRAVREVFLSSFIRTQGLHSHCRRSLTRYRTSSTCPKLYKASLK